MQLGGVLRYGRIAFKILTTQYPYNRFRLLADYARLLVHAYTAARQGQRTTSTPFTESFMGFTILFNRYAELINLVEEIFIYEAYKFHTTQTSPLIVDCGSHIGMSVLYHKLVYPDAIIIAFEPEENNFNLLQKNILTNKLENVVPHRVALSDEAGPVVMKNAGTSSLNWTIVPSETSEDQNAVPNKRLSDYCSERIDFLKIDTEGSEVAIIKDLQKTDKLRLVQRMTIEFHPESNNASPDQFVEFIQSAGFKCSKHALRMNLNSSELLIRCTKE